MLVAPEVVAFDGVDPGLARHRVGWRRSLIGDEDDGSGFAVDGGDGARAIAGVAASSAGKSRRTVSTVGAMSSGGVSIRTELSLSVKTVAEPSVLCAHPRGDGDDEQS